MTAVRSAAATAHLAKSLGALEAHALDNSGVEAWFANAPVEFRQFDAEGIQQRWFASVMAVAALLDTARPAAMKISGNPSAPARRFVQPEMTPGMTATRMFNDAAPSARRRKRRLEAALIITLDFAFSGALDMQRLSCPELPPSLAGWMRHDWPWAGIVPGISCLVPRINAREIEIRAASFDVKRRNHAATPRRASIAALAHFEHDAIE